MSERRIEVQLTAPGERLDKVLAGELAAFDLSRTQVHRLIVEGFVALGGQTVTRPSLKLAGGEWAAVRVPPSPPSRAAPEAIALAIVYEDDDVLVLDKPAGMVVHPAAGHSSGTLVNALLAHAPEVEEMSGDDEQEAARPGIVHRLDKDTSGLMIVAKHDRARHWLQAQFKQRAVQKTYLALVDGRPPTPAGRVEAPIGRDPRQRKRMAVVPLRLGREAITDYRTLEALTAHTLLECHPLTGRTHQIRVHLAFLRCPIVADTVYGRRQSSLPGLARHFLHAAQLTVRLPGQPEPRTFVAPLPEDLQAVLEELRSGLSTDGADGRR